jgi:hypothetical protein
MRVTLLGLWWLVASLALARPAPARDELPANLAAQPAYQAFVKQRSIQAQKALRLPNSPYLFILVQLTRLADAGLWSPDPADGIDAQLFVYHLFSKQIDPTLTQQFNTALGATKHYDPDFCGGLGSLAPADFVVSGDRLRLTQFYAPGTERSNCQVEIGLRNGLPVLFKPGTSLASTSLATEVAKERARQNAEAVRLFQLKRTTEAVYLWEELYGHWLNGPYATAGPYDEILNNLGFAYHQLKLYKQAETVLRQCQRSFPQRKIVYLNIADLYRDMGNRAAARHFYRQFAQLGVSEAQKKYAEQQAALLK